MLYYHIILYTDERYALIKGKQIKSMAIDHFNYIWSGTKFSGALGFRKKIVVIS